MKFVVKPFMFSSVMCALMVLAACTSTSSRFGSRTTRSSQPPEQLTPVNSGSVNKSSLPPVGGASSTQTASNGDPTFTEGRIDGGAENLFGDSDPSFVSLDDLDTNTNVAGRNLTGPLTVLKLLGVWTVQSGENTCRLNLTQSAKGSTGRYRASSPGCIVPAVAAVSSWQLAGNQVQLFNEAGQLIGALLQNGDRFVGTMVGGQGISMVG
ncbi:AprI/Inh family metalloprotease inhibitor [Maritalea sp.]|uniref:AprI/Inh family metalloprotease inhibitor n=1 Tax=Maritalea sp. TaxID=2003361 RepID=UPI003EF2FF3D